MTEIFVFGSNLAGRHGRGSAREALLKHGAVYGCGVGRQGQSYAIPTKDEALVVLPLARIEAFVKQIFDYARGNPGLTFRCVAVGCGLAGYSHADMAPLFRGAPSNVNLPPEWRRYVG